MTWLPGDAGRIAEAEEPSEGGDAVAPSWDQVSPTSSPSGAAYCRDHWPPV